MVSFTKTALLAAAALALVASTADASVVYEFPTNVGKASFASGASLTFTLTNNVLSYVATGVTEDTAATVSKDSWSCDEESTTSYGAIANVNAPVGIAVTPAGSDFRVIAGLRVDMGTECALIMPTEQVGGTKFYGGVVGNFGSGDASVDAIMFPTSLDTDKAATAVGHISFSVGDTGIGGTVTAKSGLFVNQKYTVKFSVEDCNVPTPAYYLGTGGDFAYAYDLETGPDSGAFTQNNDPDASTAIKLDKFITTPDTIANMAVRVHYVNETIADAVVEQMVMCGYVSYLPKVRGYMAAYPNLANQLVIVGKAVGLQKKAGLKGTMHMHAASSTVDDPVDFPRCTDGNTVGKHVKVVDVQDGTTFNDHFLAGLATDGDGDPNSVLTYSPDATTGEALINGQVTGYWTLEDIKYQAIVMHTRQAGAALELELKAGCGNMGGVDPAETEQGGPGSDFEGGPGKDGENLDIDGNSGTGSSVVLSASALVVAALVNALV